MQQLIEKHRHKLKYYKLHIEIVKMEKGSYKVIAPNWNRVESKPKPILR